MKIEFDIDDNNAIMDVVDGFVVIALKRHKQILENWDGYVHPDDVKLNKKIIKSINRILKYYGEKV